VSVQLDTLSFESSRQALRYHKSQNMVLCRAAMQCDDVAQEIS
jgi:hypothetical protein